MNLPGETRFLTLTAFLLVALCAPAIAQESVDLLSGDRVPAGAEDVVDLLSGEQAPAQEPFDLTTIRQISDSIASQKTVLPDDKGWHLGKTAYFWFPRVRGTVCTPGRTGTVRASATDVDIMAKPEWDVFSWLSMLRGPNFRMIKLPVTRLPGEYLNTEPRAASERVFQDAI
jgi:hypothetical protein